ncbi:hypothetical protein [Nocardia sp. NPDC004711]
MRSRPTALGYLRKDVSGIRQAWDETEIRSLAKRLGYDLAKTVTFDERTERPLVRLCTVVARLDAEVIITPGAEHFGGEVPADLVGVVDVVTVKPEYTYARWSSGELPDLRPGEVGKARR